MVAMSSTSLSNLCFSVFPSFQKSSICTEDSCSETSSCFVTEPSFFSNKFTAFGQLN